MSPAIRRPETPSRTGFPEEDSIASFRPGTLRMACWSTADLQILQFRGTPLRTWTRSRRGHFNLLRMAKEESGRSRCGAPCRRRPKPTWWCARAAAVDRTRRQPEESRSKSRRSWSATAAERYFLVVFAAPDDASCHGAPSRSPRARARDRDEQWRSAAGTGRNPRIPAQYDGAVRSARRRTAGRQRRGPQRQRRTAVHQRGTRHHQGGTAVGQRRADHRQRRTAEPQPANWQRPTATSRTCWRRLRSPIVMVDQDLRVRRFNSAAEKLLELGSGRHRPAGRPSAGTDSRRRAWKTRSGASSSPCNAISEELQDAGRVLVFARSSGPTGRWTTESPAR